MCLWLKCLELVNMQGPQDDDNRAQKLTVSWDFKQDFSVNHDA